MTLVKFHSPAAPIRSASAKPHGFPWSEPRVNVVKTTEGYEIMLAAPGMQKEDFHIKLEDKTLVVKGASSRRENAETETFKRREFQYGVFEKHFAIPDSLDSNSVKANYLNGILTISLAFKPEVKPVFKEIAIG